MAAILFRLRCVQPWRNPFCIFTFQHLITQRSVEIIQNHNPAEPLFLFVSHADPHAPIEVFRIQIQIRELFNKQFSVYFRIFIRWLQAKALVFNTGDIILCSGERFIKDLGHPKLGYPKYPLSIIRILATESQQNFAHITTTLLS